MATIKQIFTIEDKLSKPNKWIKVGDKYFIPYKSEEKNNKSYGSSKIIDKLPPGYYQSVIHTGRLIENIESFEKINVKKEKTVEFSNSPQEKILKELLKFWESKNKYDNLNLPYKRGILLYGPPGNGKSTILKSIIEQCSDLYGTISIKFSIEFDFMLSKLRLIEKNKKIIIIMEDIDGIFSEESWYASEILNMLDGNNDIFTNCVFLATTNYPEKLKERLLNRPSRFDKRFKIDNPNNAVRGQYIKSLMSRLKEKGDIKEDQIVKDTKGFSLSHIKELFTDVFIFDTDYKKSVKNLQDMKDKKISSFDDEDHNPVGFGRTL